MGARLATAAGLIAALLAALFFLPRSALAAVAACVALLGGWEWARLCGFPRVASQAYAVAAALCVAGLAWTGAGRAALVIGAAFWLAVAPLWLWRGVKAAHRPLLAAAGLAVLVPAALALTLLSPLQALLALMLTWIADTAAYFAGSRFGRRKLAPTISPGKTWEGVFGALGASLAYGAACAALVPQLRAGISGAGWAVYGAAIVLLCVASVIGDLFESAAKRQASVKDSGNLLPGHGGVLDRIDSATAVLPLAAVLWPYVGLGR
ncbi:MAG: phosphatidate cytidylyltransferase [Betaproteobacteria bacterium]|nr:phosphatidate cytidylyltransferase [Betaproteobacteria bacterium]